MPAGVLRSFTNTGQSCQAPTRMFVHRSQRDDAVALAKRAADTVRVGDPLDPQTTMGPLVSKAQFDKVQGLIERGIQEGATLVCGGTGRPVGFNRGYFVRPTVFADVTQDMKIAREEIFGPVLSILRWSDLEEAIATANSVEYGLTAAIWTHDITQAMRTAKRIQSGFVWINGVNAHVRAVPFGGYKNSGVGRERGIEELYSYTEEKSVQIFL